MQFSGDLFDRIPEDEDFLDARIGIGNIDAVRKIEYMSQLRKTALTASIS